MANHDGDVIELGSSDEETEPAPKKKRPMPKAMVHIPSKLPGVTIKPATKPKINPVSIAKGNIGKAVTVTKVPVIGSSKLSNPFAKKIAQNGNVMGRKPTQSVVNPAVKILPALKNLRQIQPLPGKATKIVKVLHGPPNLLQPQPIIPGSLPPGITVKRTSQLQSVLKRNMKPNPVNIQKRKAIQKAFKKASSEMVCVDLDDDDAAPNPVGPQWYLRPEEQEKKNEMLTKSPRKSTDMVKSSVKTTNEKKTTGERKEPTDLEKLNNKEPDTHNYIEITIEDSPAKPQSKRTCEVADMAITIDDSPVKAASEKPAPTSGSDEETTTTTKEKHSKKKLEYPKAAKELESVTIEIELTPVDNANAQNDVKTQDGVAAMEVVEIQESPLKPAECLNTSTPKKKALPKPQITKMNDITDNVLKSKSKQNENRPENVAKPRIKLNKKVPPTKPGEFHPVYQSFIDLCFQLEDSKDMNKIVEMKIKAYYRKAPKEYTESEMFIDMVSSKIMAMKAGPEKMYLYIKDVVDELNLQIKIAKSQPPKAVAVNKEQDKFLYGEDSEFDSKRQRQIRKLEKTLKKLHRAIQKLEQQEVDFDDEEDSVYLLTESEDETSKKIDQPLEKSELLKRYKERTIRVHAKLCQLTNTKMPSEPRVQIDGRPGQPKGPAKRLEKWINKKVPIGTPLPFPDFHDVLRCVRDANQEDKLCWNEADIMEEASDLFTRCGKKLQRRRQENEWRLANSRIQSEIDPAEESADLKKALEDNRRVASKRESEVFNKYADRQNQLNLEAVEIGDKEAEESPVETDDEEPTEDVISLTKKRKKGLKKLLQKKSKKGDEKEPSTVETKMSENDSSTQVEKAKETDNEKRHSERHNNHENAENLPQPDMETDPMSRKQNYKGKDPLSTKETRNSDIEKIHSLSDDSNKIDSDIDELHLLQKLHSDVCDSSTLESSDSESPIAISDTLSSGDNRKQASDVISIENSSYSESEKNNEQEYDIVGYSQKKVVKECVNTQVEIECSDAGVERIINKSNNYEYNVSVEDILLASSNDEASNDKNEREDPISKDETVNVKQSTDENAKDANQVNADTTDASSMDSTEMTSIKSPIQYESSEVFSVPSTENSNDDNITTTAEIISSNPIEMVVDDIITSPVGENAQTDVPTSVAPAAIVEDTAINSTENYKNETMSLLKENTETAGDVNDDDSVEDKVTSEVENNNSEVSINPTQSDEDENTEMAGDLKKDDSLEDKVTSEVENNNSEVSINPTQSDEDKVTTDKTDVETSKVNNEVMSTETAEEHGSNNTENITV